MADDTDKKTMEQLQHLFDQGILTKDEFEQKKKMVTSDTDKQLEKALNQLGVLHNDGVLTSKEYEEKKKDLINSSTNNQSSLREPNALTQQTSQPKEGSQSKSYTFSELSEAIKKTEKPNKKTGNTNKKKDKDVGFFIRVIAMLLFIGVGAILMYEPKTDPIKYTNSIAEGETVYVDLVSIEPLYGTYAEDAAVGADYTSAVCKCVTSDGETVWVAIPYSVYIEKFDSSAKDSVLNRITDLSPFVEDEMPQKLEYSNPNRINAVVDSSENVAEGLGSKIGERVLVYEDFLN